MTPSGLLVKSSYVGLVARSGLLIKTSYNSGPPTVLQMQCDEYDVDILIMRLTMSSSEALSSG